uniref:Uncharacterized protein n=1 Tax=Moniliophthora roreri TaxID=221103 RepID=A0A0W0FBS6_MONRR
MAQAGSYPARTQFGNWKAKYPGQVLAQQQQRQLYPKLPDALYAELGFGYPRGSGAGTDAGTGCC